MRVDGIRQIAAALRHAYLHTCAHTHTQTEKRVPVRQAASRSNHTANRRSELLTRSANLIMRLCFFSISAYVYMCVYIKSEYTCVYASVYMGE